MKIQSFENEQSWLDARRGKITGTRLKDLISKRGSNYKIGFFKIIAERIAIPANEENVMDRGHRLEVDGIEIFEKATGKKVDKSLVMIFRDDDTNIAYSPDGFIGETEDVEVKCLSSARHIEAWLKKYYWNKSDVESIPAEYYEQILQGFIVNDKLQRRYMVFYDPLMPKDFFYLTIDRKDVQEEVAADLIIEREKLEEISKIEELLTF